MVNPGHPSRGCQPCKKAKTKCDESRPACGRCARRKTTAMCLYSASSFKSMNQWTETNVQTRVANKLSARATQDTPRKDIAFNISTIKTSELAAAKQLFLTEFVRYPDHLGSNWGTNKWITRAIDSPGVAYLRASIDACALSYSANVHKRNDLDTLACESYGASCSGLADALQDVSAANTFEPLACMMLLALYETISGTKPSSEPFHAHANGQSVTVHLSSSTLSDTSSEVDRVVWADTNRQMIWRDLAERNRPTLGVRCWPANVYSSWLEEASARLAVRTAELCGTVRELQMTGATKRDAHAQAGFCSCVGEALSIHRAIDTCFATAPPEWLPFTVPGPWRDCDALADAASLDDLSNLVSQISDFSLRPALNNRTETVCHAERPKYHPRYDVYPSKPLTMLWLYVRVAKLHLLRAMLDIRRLDDEDTFHFSSFGFPAIEDIRSKLSDTIHDMCAALPYMFDEVPGYVPDLDVSGHSSEIPVLCWALHKVCAIPGVSSEIREWAVIIFERIGNEKFVHQGFKLAHLYRRLNPSLSGRGLD